MDFYHRSNTHDPDQDGFEDLYRRNFIHSISHVACRKLACHRLDPYQCVAFRRSIICHNMGEEEANPTLELAMEYAGALGTIIFDESCRLHDLMEAQVGRNQFAVDVAVDWLDREVDHTAERIGVLEDKEADTERSLNALLEFGSGADGSFHSCSSRVGSVGDVRPGSTEQDQGHGGEDGRHVRDDLGVGAYRCQSIRSG